MDLLCIFISSTLKENMSVYIHSFDSAAESEEFRNDSCVQEDDSFPATQLIKILFRRDVMCQFVSDSALNTPHV